VLYTLAGQRYAKLCKSRGCRCRVYWYPRFATRSRMAVVCRALCYRTVLVSRQPAIACGLAENITCIACGLEHVNQTFAMQNWTHVFILQLMTVVAYIHHKQSLSDCITRLPLCQRASSHAQHSRYTRSSRRCTASHMALLHIATPQTSSIGHTTATPHLKLPDLHLPRPLYRPPTKHHVYNVRLSCYLRVLLFARCS
jgi:hypothetical protein